MSHHSFKGVFRRFVINRVARPETLAAQLLYTRHTGIALVVEHTCADAAPFIGPDEEYMGREFLNAPPLAV